MQLGLEISTELCLCVAWLSEVCRNLATDISARVVHWDAAWRLARKLNLSEGTRTARRTTTATSVASARACTRVGLSLLAVGCWQLETSNFSLLKVRSSCRVDVALHALGPPRLRDKSPVHIVAHFNGVAKLADFHATILNQAMNFPSDLVGVLCQWHALDIDV